VIHPTRTLALSFRVTPDELDVLRRSAGEQSVSDFIRSRLFDYAAVPVAKRLPGEAVGPLHDGSHPDCLVCAAAEGAK
jgi:hypothetical protein